jgi:hypothetical protein
MGKAKGEETLLGKGGVEKGEEGMQGYSSVVALVVGGSKERTKWNVRSSVISYGRKRKRQRRSDCK